MTNRSCLLLYPEGLEQCLAHNRGLTNTSGRKGHPVQRPWLDSRSGVPEVLLREGGRCWSPSQVPELETMD